MQRLVGSLKPPEVSSSTSVNMKEAILKRTVACLMVLGLMLLLLAVYLAVFTELQNEMGMQGIKIIAAVAGTGLILLIPSKIFLTLWLMMKGKQ